MNWMLHFRRILMVSLTILGCVQKVRAVSNYNPIGVFGEDIRKWKQPWSNAFFKCLAQIPLSHKLLTAVEGGKLNDVGPGRQWCSAGDLTREPNAKLFYLAAFKALASPESGYRETISNPWGPNGTAIGLYQIGVDDARRHRCHKPDGGRIASSNDLKVGVNNICCALQIATNIETSPLTAKHHSTFASGRKGILGAFWQPMQGGVGGDGHGGRVNNSRNSNSIKQKVNAVCRQMKNKTLDRSFSITELAMAGAVDRKPIITPVARSAPLEEPRQLRRISSTQ